MGGAIGPGAAKRFPTGLCVSTRTSHARCPAAPCRITNRSRTGLCVDCAWRVCFGFSPISRDGWVMALATPGRGRPMAAPIPTETVPLNIWPCAQVPVAEQWTDAGYASRSAVYSAALFPELARRIVATYTSPGDLVVEAAAGSGVASVEAARLHRRAVAVSPTDELAALAT